MNLPKRFVVAFSAMSAMVALFPVVAIALTVILMPVGIGIVLAFAIGPAFAHLYPYFFVGERNPNYEIVRLIEWYYALPLTVLHWFVLAVLFAKMAQRLRGVLLILASCIFLLAVVFATHLFCSAVGIQLLVQQPRM
ncbi:hypothetical protein [Methylibium rhizosphaerae]|uniref:hypothetical protein n=1 Tax=Methylibium rhizosphaerae TaxID=2570323 RepID=UPI00112BE831|nr:hypothetical protein [Methylibium rhizosphaerae]